MLTDEIIQSMLSVLNFKIWKTFNFLGQSNHLPSYFGAQDDKYFPEAARTHIEAATLEFCKPTNCHHGDVRSEVDRGMHDNIPGDSKEQEAPVRHLCHPGRDD